MTRKRFALYVIPSIFDFPLRQGERFVYDQNLTIEHTSLKSLITPSASGSWEQFIGTANWRLLTNESIIVMVTSDIQHDETAANNQLESRLQNFLSTAQAMHNLRPPHEQIILVLGFLTQELNDIKLEKITGLGFFYPWLEPGYMNDPIFEKWELSTISKRSDENGRNPSFSLDEHKHYLHQYEDLQKDETKGEHYLISFLSFVESFKTLNLEFKIPHLVRCIEGISPIKINGGGKKVFSKRVMMFLSNFSTWCYSPSREELSRAFEEIYEIRHDCVHGKTFRNSLSRSNPTDWEQRIFKYEYFLEMACREVLRKSIYMEDLLSRYHNRELLEEIWSNGAVNVDHIPTTLPKQTTLDQGK